MRNRFGCVREWGGAVLIAAMLFDAAANAAPPPPVFNPAVSERRAKEEAAARRCQQNLSRTQHPGALGSGDQRDPNCIGRVPPRPNGQSPGRVPDHDPGVPIFGLPR